MFNVCLKLCCDLHTIQNIDKIVRTIPLTQTKPKIISIVINLLKVSPNNIVLQNTNDSCKYDVNPNIVKVLKYIISQKYLWNLLAFN